MVRPSISTAKAALRSTLYSDGIRSALVYVNRITGHRFASLYRFGGDLLQGMFFYDHTNPSQGPGEAVPVSATYCVLIRDTQQAVRFDDSHAEPRVASHPKRDVVRAYCGVPLTDDGGRMFGTLCVFDFDSKQSHDEDIELLEHFADLLRERERSLRRPDHGSASRPVGALFFDI